MRDRDSENEQGDISDDEMEKIAKRSADIVWKNFQLEVGRITIRSLLHGCWIAGLALLGWAKFTGKIIIP